MNTINILCWNTEPETAPTVPPFTGTPGPTVVLEDGATPVQYFFLFFTQRIWEFLVEETNRYAAHKIAQKTPSRRSLLSTWKPVTLAEMKAFVGVILNMGIIQLPDIKDYWSTSETTSIGFFRYFSVQTNKSYNNNILLIPWLGLSLQEIASYRSFACSMSVTLPYPPQHQRVPKLSHCLISCVHPSPTITTLIVRSQWMKP